MSKTADRTDPELWEAVKNEIIRGDKGGEPGQWSARKAQMAVQEYKKRGGGYRGRKSEDNSLVQWTEEEWATKSGEKSRDTGERYLPEEALQVLTDREYRETSAKKRKDRSKGRQFSAQPPAIAEKSAHFRHHADGKVATKAELMAEAGRRGIAGRSKMDRAMLERALEAEIPDQGRN